MKVLNKILDAFPDEEFLKADGFDGAIIGVDTWTGRLIYSMNKTIKIARKSMPELSADEVNEYLSFNTFSAYMGEKTPIWCDDISWLEE